MLMLLWRSLDGSFSEPFERKCQGGCTLYRLVAALFGIGQIFLESTHSSGSSLASLGPRWSSKLTSTSSSANDTSGLYQAPNSTDKYGRK